MRIAPHRVRNVSNLRTHEPAGAAIELGLSGLYAQFRRKTRVRKYEPTEVTQCDFRMSIRSVEILLCPWPRAQGMRSGLAIRWRAEVRCYGGVNSLIVTLIKHYVRLMGGWESDSDSDHNNGQL